MSRMSGEIGKEIKVVVGSQPIRASYTTRRFVSGLIGVIILCTTPTALKAEQVQVPSITDGELANDTNEKDIIMEDSLQESEHKNTELDLGNIKDSREMDKQTAIEDEAEEVHCVSNLYAQLVDINDRMNVLTRQELIWIGELIQSNEYVFNEFEDIFYPKHSEGIIQLFLRRISNYSIEDRQRVFETDMGRQTVIRVLQQSFYDSTNIKTSEIDIISKIDREHKILFMSDLQISELVHSPQHIKDYIHKVSPTILVIGGDIVSKVEDTSRIEDYLGGLSISYKYYVKGNQEHSMDESELRQLDTIMEDIGFQDIDNINLELDGFNIIGIGDVRSRKADITKAYDNLNTDNPLNLVFTHNHDVNYEMDRLIYPADLIVSGHTLGGQIVGEFEPPVKNTTLWEDRGMFTGEYPFEGENKTYRNYTVNGLGGSGTAIRLNAQQETLVINLYKREEDLEGEDPGEDLEKEDPEEDLEEEDLEKEDPKKDLEGEDSEEKDNETPPIGNIGGDGGNEDDNSSPDRDYSTSEVDHPNKPTTKTKETDKVIQAYSKGQEMPFTDISDSPHRDQIISLYNRGVIKGYEDKTFKPNNKLTRAEFVQMMTVGFNLEYTGEAKVFQDVPSHKWYYKSITTASGLEIIYGISHTHFGPDLNISRESALTMLSRLLGRSLDFKPTIVEIENTLAVSEWAKEPISNLISVEVLNKNNLPEMKQLTTRGEVVSYIYNILEVMENNK